MFKRVDKFLLGSIFKHSFGVRVLPTIANTMHQVGTCFWRFFTFLRVLGGGLFSFIKENTSSMVS